MSKVKKAFKYKQGKNWVVKYYDKNIWRVTNEMDYYRACLFVKSCNAK